MEQKYKYFAFISYSSKDYKWGKRVQHKLEHYRMPATLCSEYGWKRKPINPVFFAPTDILPGPLTEELKARLNDSKHLIVICSPNSAQSDWVGQEIEYFYKGLERKDIHFFIVDGTPHTGDKTTECFNSVVETLGMPEILGANIHERISRWSWINKERAYVQLITKLLCVEFDSIWKRHRRMLIEKLLAWCIGIFVIFSAIIGVWLANQPVDVTISLKETSMHNNDLPPLRNAIITLVLDNETKTDTLSSLDGKALFNNIPHSAIGKDVRIKVVCKEWLPVDTILILQENQIINIARNPETYGNVSFMLWSLKKEKGMGHVKVSIAGHTSESDAKGYVKMKIPLKDQSEKYEISCGLELENNIIMMPTTQSTALIVKD